MGKLYEVLTSIYRTITPNYKITWAEPFIEEPCVFICNHAGAFGPIDMCSFFPYRENCYSWLNHDVMDPKLVPAYVRQDYWWKPGCWAEPILNVTLPYLAAAVLPPVLKSAPGIPVYHDQRVLLTMRKSLQHLKEGRYLIIFPEQPSGYKSHHMWINTGFLNVAPMFHKLTGKALRFYPVHISPRDRTFTVAKPICFDPSRTLEEQQEEIVAVLAPGLRGESATPAE